ncbi:hypothetical protein PHYBLDRAFT_145746 [Phycomyces blakesleeanus NRRL 1555(-)]|uniref:HotDog ACOT-type domain-containing protein n=1 Tax=Phycomyces blakesleeanus (strain ATCC 8743b / DSM 1359 / FGSC 10004 / NBRC 33097 / NRRL 1555) TaxID=763407 RepID=A0A167MNB0_PHYB8|nr:hypothetical protein PHYBLDRAFT_145746 [Phycomyces blakesleeanus NRRL 1555(-)]OAD73349.1 hypothetical protein PHYBLDRAFT_145746 [Phycomyces blakesleeanus NRRL 1555(-)]|eukprot:XP_018291389.1 hypothetical protein PHYBLDRAFT_145746 [Phycomyces blakesleeanus NRRL 1555(-)]
MNLKGNERPQITFDKFETKHDVVMMDSYTEKILPFKYSPSFLEKTIAHNGEISIGYLLQISDEIAYVTGTKHLDVPSCLHRVSSHILTASVENFHLILPDTVQDIRISGHAVNIGTSSIEVLVNAEIISCADNTLGIRAKLKDLTGNCITAPTSNTVFIAKFNMVAVNIETGKPAKTNSLISTNSKERTAQELANFLKNTSYISNKDTTVSTNGRPETSKSASNLEADAFDKRKNSMGGYKLVKDTTLQSAFIVTPQDRSVLGYLFGGKTLRYVYEIAYITARMFVGSNVRMFSLDEAKFHSKVNVGSTIKLTARVIYSSEDDNMFQVKVISNLSDCNGTFGSAEAMTANFTFLSLDKKIRNVVPRTLKENELYIEGLVFGETKKCHRAGQYITNRQLRLAQKDTKACSCTAALKIIQHLDNPNVVTFCQTKAHVNHVPGDWDEVRTFSLPSEAIKIIEDQLKVAAAVEMTTLLYMFASDENASISIWLNVKLAEQNYCIFEINLSVYNDGKKQFAFGFQSPMQVSIMRISQSFCLDATHSISSRSDEVLYTLVTRHPQTGKGFPVAYMVTNNQTAIPIKLWLDHLRIKSSFVPMNITIDRSIMEVNAIKEALPVSA